LATSRPDLDLVATFGEDSELLRLVTCGSVDDGKSTLIGRLLYDTKQVLADQLEHVEETSRRRGDGYVNLALLTDGLRAEREQGITIDVAYRSFVTTRRRFLLADAPGHVQYTRNMVTGASTADVAVILVDARNGVVEQTRRHTFIAGLLGIPHVVVAINKMDLAEFSAERFAEIAEEACAVARSAGIPDPIAIPMSALRGDNVVDRSGDMDWYEGPTLLEHLEAVEIAADRNVRDGRFPVQWVIRPMSDEHHDYRGYAGQIASGAWRAGDEVVVLPSGRATRVSAVETHDGPLDVAIPPMSVVIRLGDNIDIGRGDMIAHAVGAPTPARQIEATVCWMSERPLAVGARVAVKHTTRSVRAIIDQIVDRVEMETLERVAAPDGLALNEIGHVHLRLSEPIMADPYVDNRVTGAIILIDEATNETIAAGMISSVDPSV
jgi:sulfate adenylyltransferase large subunit